MSAAPPEPDNRSPQHPAAPPAGLDLLVTPGFADYALLDSGNGRKLERFGKIVVDRPEAQALWQPHLPKSEWTKAHAVFSASGEDDEKGKWRVDKPVPESWPVQAGAATMLCRLSGLWHLGLFPEQMPHWQWMRERIEETAKRTGEPPRVLNLFGYTGAASLIAAAAGAHVAHVDASKKSVQWGKDNQAASKLTDKPIRWLVDDAKKFVARDIRRAKTYNMILVDPPKFGRGPDGETWDLFADLPEFLKGCAALLDPNDAHMVLTVYAIRASTLAFRQLLQETLASRGGRYETGELAIIESAVGPAKGGQVVSGQPKRQQERLVPTSFYTRWSSR